MEKIICASCGATMTPNTTQPFLTCAYCDTTVPNAYYNESDAKAAAEPTLADACLQALREMGADAKLSELDANAFGDPLYITDTSRAALNIPDGESVYLLYDHFSLFGSLKEGFALTDTGMYYKHDSDEGRLSWESFITGAISCVTPDGLFDTGTLSVGSSLTFEVSGDGDARLARFLIDFHNRVYQQHTGDPAPAAWAVTEPVKETAASTAATGGSTLGKVLTAGGVLTAAQALLGGKPKVRSTAYRTGTLHPARKPVPARPPVVRAEPSRPARPAAPKPQPKPVQRHAQPGAAHPLLHQRPGTSRPGMNRPAGGPGGRGGMGGPGGRGGMGGPGGRGGMGGPGGRGGMGGPGKGRR